MTQQHDLMGGKLHLYKRDNSRFWQCATYLAGRNRRVSTKFEALSQAKAYAESWYIQQRIKGEKGELPSKPRHRNEKKFAEAADHFICEFKALTLGQRSPIYVDGHERRIRVHLNPFFGDKYLSEITPGLLQEYRIWRLEKGNAPRGKPTPEPAEANGAKPERVKPPARNTIHQEIVVLRQTLKAAIRQGWLDRLPDLSEPYKKSGKVSHRAWFSGEEYKKLYEATRRRTKNPPKPRHLWSCEQLHDYVLFMGNTGLRPDEAARLEFRDVKIVEDEATGETILLIEVRGKRGTGYCKSMPGAVTPFTRLRDRWRSKFNSEGKKVRALPEPTDLLFPMGGHHELFKTVLEEEDLRHDREGQTRTAYSLRHTYICLRLTEGADIYQIAKNCRTSVEMIQKYYAAHITTSLDAAAINVRRPKPPKRKAKVAQPKRTEPGASREEKAA